MNKRSFAIVALSIVCLSTILAAVPTNSLVGYYDPWLDYDENGTIDVKDVAASARAFGSYGDPTKNVNVMNWPVMEQCAVWWNEPLGPADQRWSDEFQSKGFSQLHILLFTDILTVGEQMSFEIMGVMWNADHTEGVFPTYYSTILTSASDDLIFSLPVPSQTFMFFISTDASTDVNVYLNYYLTGA